MTTDHSAARLRTAVIWLLGTAIVVAGLSLVLDGGRPAVASGHCQYAPYVPDGEPCPVNDPSLTTEAQPSAAEVNWGVYDRATLSGGAGPTGSITFSLYAPGDTTCTNAVHTSVVPVNGNGDYYSWQGVWTGSNTVAQLGTWQWTAAYSGDANNHPVATACGDEPVEVSKRTTGLYLTPYSSQSLIGWGIAAYGWASASQPTGSVTVSLYGPDDPTCSGTPEGQDVIPFNGSEFISLYSSFASTGSLGTWRWTADYPGDDFNTPASISCGAVSTEVVRAQPFLWAGATPSSVAVGGEVSVGGSVYDGYAPTGRVTLTTFAPGDTSCQIPVASTEVAIDPDGSYRAPFTLAVVGTWRVTASYPGDTFNEAAAVGCGQLTVEATKATPSLAPAATPTTAEVGAALNAFALIQNGYDADGMVIFRLYPPSDPSCNGVATHVEEASLNGTTVTTGTGFAAGVEGTWQWTIQYLGDDDNEAVTSPCGSAPVSVVKKVAKPPKNPGGTPYPTNVYGNCVDDHTIVVPPDGRLVLRLAWGALTKQQADGFLRNTTTSASVDGTAVKSPKAYWSKPVFDSGQGLWITRWVYDTGRVVTSGSPPFTVNFEVVATKVVTDGLTTWNPGDAVVSIGGPCLVVGTT